MKERGEKDFNTKQVHFISLDLDGDDNIDVTKYRRWTDHGNLSAPIWAYYNKNGDMKISCDAVATSKDPLHEAGKCPPRKRTTPEEV